MKKTNGFNIPFEKLDNFKVKVHKNENLIEDKNSAACNENDNDISFEQAMKGVRRIKQTRITPESINNEKIMSIVRQKIISESDEAIRTLKDIVKGASNFDIRQSGEYVEGYVVDLEPTIIESLKKGELSIQSHIDLHGMTSNTAKERVLLFVKNSYSLGYRCILIIHGRGLKSPAGPVIKNNVVHWLTSGVLSRYVLAFCSARPCDGGVGALYVLMKSRPGRKKIKRTA